MSRAERPAPAAIVPAAGEARRMGRDKLALPWRDARGRETTVLGATVAALLAGGAERVVVVVRPEGPEARAGLVGAEGDGRVAVTVNPDPARGMLSSIVAGVAALDPDARGETSLLVAPADLPALAPATVARVVAALAGGARLAVPRDTTSGRRGHPLGIAAPLAAEIPRLDPDQGLRQLLDRHPEALVELPVDDPGCVTDVDTPDAYRRLRQRG